jgi:hypothetical protein
MTTLRFFVDEDGTGFASFTGMRRGVGCDGDAVALGTESAIEGCGGGGVIGVVVVDGRGGMLATVAVGGGS